MDLLGVSESIQAENERIKYIQAENERIKYIQAENERIVAAQGNFTKEHQEEEDTSTDEFYIVTDNSDEDDNDDDTSNIESINDALLEISKSLNLDEGSRLAMDEILLQSGVETDDPSIINVVAVAGQLVVSEIASEAWRLVDKSKSTNQPIRLTDQLLIDALLSDDQSSKKKS